MKYASNLAKDWLDVCRIHKWCSPGDDKPLPSRVLELFGSHLKPSLRLVDGRTKTARYLALSHCWGSIDSRPLRTTRQNIEQHQNMIPFHDLPKTFRDFVELARGLSVKYIWIDSLCIIQDDLSDWQSEAERMGDVYRNAALVVAASGAKDSTEGLFVSERPRAIVYRLPYRIGGVCKGTFNITYLPVQRSERWRPGYGPLSRRAWALQERYLARRMMTFMPGGVSWICKSIGINERCMTQYFFPEAEGWFKLLEIYTAAALTYPSDRLEALKGIAAELQYSRKDRYHPKYGVWEDDLVEHLFWLPSEPQNDDGALNLPSWSWAATQGKKIWPTTRSSVKYHYSKIARAEELLERLEVTAAGCIKAFGPLGTTQSHVRHAITSGAARSRVQSALGTSFALSPVDSLFGSRCFLLGSTDTGEAEEGFAVFDQEERTSCTHHLLAFKAHKPPPESPQFMQFKFKDTDGADLEQEVLGVDFIYWTLLLDQVEEGKYKRVGVGILYPSAYDTFKVELQELQII